MKWEEIKANIRETQFMAAKLHTELHKHSEGHKTVGRRCSQVQDAGHLRVMALRGQHAEESNEVETLEKVAEELEGERNELEKDISTTKQQKENLSSTLATREKEHQAQLARKEELNTELEELKKQCRCNIS